MTLIFLVMTMTKKPRLRLSELKLSVLPLTMLKRPKKRPRKANLSPNLTLSLISNPGMMKPIWPKWKSLSAKSRWTDSSGAPPSFGFERLL